MVAPLIALAGSAIITVVPMIWQYFQDEKTVSEIQNAVDSLTVEYVPGMTFTDFLLDSWIYLILLAGVCWISLKIAYPKKKKNRI